MMTEQEEFQRQDFNLHSLKIYARNTIKCLNESSGQVSYLLLDQKMLKSEREPDLNKIEVVFLSQTVFLTHH